MPCAGSDLKLDQKDLQYGLMESTNWPVWISQPTKKLPTWQVTSLMVVLVVTPRKVVVVKEVAIPQLHVAASDVQIP